MEISIRGEARNFFDFPSLIPTKGENDIRTRYEVFFVPLFHLWDGGGTVHWEEEILRNFEKFLIQFGKLQIDPELHTVILSYGTPQAPQPKKSYSHFRETLKNEKKTPFTCK